MNKKNEFIADNRECKLWKKEEYKERIKRIEQ